MLRLLSHLGACGLALLALPACDTGRPEVAPPTDALVGSWSLVETTAVTSLTASEAQTVVDRGGAPQGAIAFSGAATGTLRFFSVDADGQTVLTSYDPALNVPDGARYELQFTPSGAVYFYATQASGASTAYDGSGPAPTAADGQIAVGRLVLRRSGGGQVVVAGGTLAFPRVPLAAGQRTPVRTATVAVGSDPSDPASAVRYVFAADGAFRSVRTFFSGQTETRRGTWAVDGGRLRLSVTGSADETFGYTIREGRLELAASPSACRDAGCLRAAEVEFGLRDGTLTALDVQTTRVFDASTGAGS